MIKIKYDQIMDRGIRKVKLNKIYMANNEQLPYRYTNSKNRCYKEGATIKCEFESDLDDIRKKYPALSERTHYNQCRLYIISEGYIVSKEVFDDLKLFFDNCGIRLRRINEEVKIIGNEWIKSDLEIEI